MSELKVRAITASDAPRVAALNAQLGYSGDIEEVCERLQRIAAKSDHWVLGAESGGTIVGFIHVFGRPSVDKGFDMIVQALIVDETQRQSGVGRALLQAAETLATSQGASGIALSSRVDRADAHAFYGRLGYDVFATACVFVKTLG